MTIGSHKKSWKYTRDGNGRSTGFVCDEGKYTIEHEAYTDDLYQLHFYGRFLGNYRTAKEAKAAGERHNETDGCTLESE